MTREEALNDWPPIIRQMVKGTEVYEEALDMAIKALEQQSCYDVPEINDGNIYECSCGYGWNKNKVVRHHFCPNCGKAVDGAKMQLQPCEDCISRQAVLDIAKSSKSNWIDNSVLFKRVNALPPVSPMQRWIPVSERLPEPDRKDEAGNDIAFLVQTEWGTFFTATYDGNWCHVDSSILVDSDVIAWMPLPLPYKVESEG